MALFTRFVDLPAEPHSKIWTLAATTPRVIEIRVSGQTVTTCTRPHPLLHVSFESRTTRLSHNGDRLEVQNSKEPQAVNFTHNFFFVTGDYDFPIKTFLPEHLQSGWKEFGFSQEFQIGWDTCCQSFLDYKRYGYFSKTSQRSSTPRQPQNFVGIVHCTTATYILTTIGHHALVVHPANHVQPVYGSRASGSLRFSCYLARTGAISGLHLTLHFPSFLPQIRSCAREILLFVVLRTPNHDTMG